MAPGSEALDPACVLCIHMGLRARSDEVPAGDAAKLAPRLKELSCGPLRLVMILPLLLIASSPWFGVE